MGWTYRCTQCGVMLNPHETIMLVAERGDARVLAGFHPEPGNYEIYFPPEVTIEAGEKWSFSCPVCHKDLVSEENDNLCALDFQEGEEHSTLLFSRVAGERATYVVAEGTVKAKHGEHAQSYFEYLMSVRVF